MSHLAPLSDCTDYLRRPLASGQAVTYWQLSATAQAPYDVADEPLRGEMDPFFFLTKHKNFIPHEYPCRTAFIAAHRGQNPKPVGTFEASRNWLPFASPRVDLSGFWFRPTKLGTWARTCIQAKAGGPATFSLATCGGARLLVNGQEAGWIAHYGRNLETRETFTATLVAGTNEILVYFDDLAERDARYYFALDYVDGPECGQALPISCSSRIAAGVEAALEQMRFEKPAYNEGEVALITSAPLSTEAAVSIEIEGDFMSRERLRLEKLLKPGARRLVIADTDDLPADFRHFRGSISVDGFTASRVFGVEICHARRQGPPPRGLTRRIAEALDEVSEFGEADTVCALARLATGRGGKETDQMIEKALTPIFECHDCADFALVPLLWCRQVYAGDIAPETLSKIDDSILNFRFWMDEPGNDVQWYFSENHALLFHTAAYLAGHLLPDAKFVRSGRTGIEQSKVGASRIHQWLDHFEQWEMAEFNSAPYFPIDLKGLTALLALAPDKDIRQRAASATKRLLEVVARSAHHGVLTGAQGRSYEHTLRAGRSLELSGISRMLWGVGNFGRRFHTLPQLGLCLRDHGLKLPEGLAEIANYTGEDAHEWCFAQGRDRIAKLYHYKTRDYACGSAAHYRWNEWGYQETVLHLRIGANPDAQIWINHPGETLHSGFGRPSYWGGSGTLPRVHQYRGLAVVVFDCHGEQPGFSHAWFPSAAFDLTIIDKTCAFAQADAGLVMLSSGGDLKLVETGPTANLELRQTGHRTTWLVRLGDTTTNGTLKRFAREFGSLTASTGSDGVISIDDPEYGRVHFLPDGSVKAQGRELTPQNWTIAGQAQYLPLAGHLQPPNFQQMPRRGVRPATPTGARSPL